MIGMTDIVDKPHLKNGLWKTIEAHLWRLESLVEQLREKLEAKDAEAVGNIGKYIVEGGIDVICDANAITVLDCLGQPLMTKISNPCPKCGSKIRVYYDSVKRTNHCLECGHAWKTES